jgi:hypothetical protein
LEERRGNISRVICRRDKPVAGAIGEGRTAEHRHRRQSKDLFWHPSVLAKLGATVGAATYVLDKSRAFAI